MIPLPFVRFPPETWESEEDPSGENSLIELVLRTRKRGCKSNRAIQSELFSAMLMKDVKSITIKVSHIDTGEVIEVEVLQAEPVLASLRAEFQLGKRPCKVSFANVEVDAKDTYMDLDAEHGAEFQIQFEESASVLGGTANGLLLKKSSRLCLVAKPQDVTAQPPPCRIEFLGLWKDAGVRAMPIKMDVTGRKTNVRPGFASLTLT